MADYWTKTVDRLERQLSEERERHADTRRRVASLESEISRLRSKLIRGEAEREPIHTEAA